MSKYAEWVVLDANDQKIKCKRCDASGPLPSNVAVSEFTRLCEEFAAKHDACIDQPFKKGDLIIPEGECFPGRAITFDRIENGNFYAYPRGGGFEMGFTLANAKKYKFRKVTEEEQRVVPIRKTRFEIDCWETSFEGYTWEDRWNGWACPAFEKKQADRIMQLLRKDGTKAAFIIDKYVIIRESEKGTEEDREEYKGEPHVVAGKTMILYPIGSGSWTWSEKREKEKKTS